MRRWILGAVIALGAIHASPARAAVVWPTEIVAVERGLQSAEVGQRRTAASRLADLPAATLERVLPVALADADPEVRLLAAAAARTTGAYGRTPTQYGRFISGWLRDPDWRLRYAAAELLTRAPDAAAIADLVRSLGDGEAAVRGQVVQALVATGQRDVVLALLGHIDDPDLTVRAQVLSGLSALGDNRATLPLIGKLQDQRPNIRAGAARALGRLQDSRAVAALLLAFADPEDEVKIAVIGALAELRADQSSETLVNALKLSKSEAVIGALLRALAQLESPQAARAVLEAVTSPDDQRAKQAEAAVQVASEPLVMMLRHCLVEQVSEAVGNACALALVSVPRAQLTPGDADLLAAALQSGVLSKAAALDALGRLELTSGLPTALAMLEDADPQLRQQAAELTAQLLDPTQPDGTAVEPLLRALEQAHAVPRLQQALLVALGRTASARASGAVLPYLGAPRPALRLAAIEALGLIAGKGSANALLPLLDDADAQVRLAAALALRRIADVSSFAPLWQRLTQAPSQDRGAIALALGGPLRAPELRVKRATLTRQILASRGPLRDVLIESASLLPASSGLALLQELADHGDPGARRKVAEVAAGYGAAAQPLLSGLLTSMDDSLLANAAWAMGSAGPSSVSSLLILAHHPDHAVASNAVASLVRVHPNPLELGAVLCELVRDPRAYVRVNALVGLHLQGQRCAQGEERRTLHNDPSVSVRLAAARLLFKVPGKEAEQDRIALARCQEQEANADVASACQAAQPASPSPEQPGEPSTVLVLPRGGGKPQPQTPFALLTASGLIRSGWTDARGAIFEHSAGTLRLVVAPQYVTIE
jgi:HEAT repeat protein